VSMGPAANAAEWLAWALAAVTGSIDRPGGMLVNPGLLRPQEHGITNRPRASGPSPESRPDLAHMYGEVPTAGLVDEIESGTVRALFVLGGNPMTTFPDTRRTAAALRTLEELVVIDIRPTETTALASLVLPCAGMLERADLPSVLDATYPVPFTQYGARVVPPQADRRPMWWMFAELMVRMGLPVPPLVARCLAAADSEEADDALLEAAASRSRIPWATLRAAPSGLLDDAAPEPGWFAPAMIPSGRLDLCPDELAEQLRRWHAVPEPVGGLRLINRRLPRQVNSLLRDVDSARRPGPGPLLLVHPDDAARRGLVSGQVVEVRTETGATEAEVQISTAIRPGAVSLPHGWAAPDVNELTSSRPAAVDPMTGMPQLSGLPVQLRAVARTPSP